MNIILFFLPPQTDSTEPVSLLNTQVLEAFIDSKPSAASVVPWSPPQTNWNPWTACNIDEGPLATVCLKLKKNNYIIKIYLNLEFLDLLIFIIIQNLRFFFFFLNGFHTSSFFFDCFKEFEFRNTQVTKYTRYV